MESNKRISLRESPISILASLSGILPVQALAVIFGACWYLLCSLVLLGVIGGVLAAIPVGLLGALIGAESFVVQLFKFCLVVPLGVFWLAVLIGMFKRWYISWVYMSIAFSFGPFLIGFGIVLFIFSSPISIVSFVSIVGLFSLLKLSFLAKSWWQSKPLRDLFLVAHYTSGQP